MQETELSLQIMQSTGQSYRMIMENAFTIVQSSFVKNVCLKFKTR